VSTGNGDALIKAKKDRKEHQSEGKKIAITDFEMRDSVFSKTTDRQIVIESGGLNSHDNPSKDNTEKDSMGRLNMNAILQKEFGTIQEDDLEEE
jgi:hypothetical protein